MYECIPSILFWPNVEDQMSPLLDLLAWEMHVDVWQNIEGEPLTDEKKIELINQSIDWHRHKGTRYAVDQMLATIFSEGAVTEWYEYGGNPYFFRIIVNETIADPTKLARVIEAVYAVKNIRSWLDTPGFMQARLYRQQLYHSIATTQHINTKIRMSV